MRPRNLKIVKPGPGQESVWDYPRPPAIRPDDRLVTVYFAGVEIARSSRTLRVLETTHPPSFYIPPGDVRVEYLEPAVRVSFCEFKGQTVHYHIRVGDRLSEDAVWCYPEPMPGYESIAGCFALYASRVDKCTVGGMLVKPQPGGFYGGWITPEVVGPFKGEPGTLSW